MLGAAAQVVVASVLAATPLLRPLELTVSAESGERMHTAVPLAWSDGDCPALQPCIRPDLAQPQQVIGGGGALGDAL